MADVIANELETFRRDINSFSELLERTHNTCKKTFAELDLLTGMWEGKANGAFRSEFLADEENMENMFLFLKKYIDALDSDHRRYTKCESDISDIIRTIEI